ncbi:MAG: hypothetical protein M3N07_02470, partial [Pseudomonadota bacterium]|nr:hypothetical protein [Pseudomonadota bacterium]
TTVVTGGATDESWLSIGYLVTAMVVAGGSAGVNNLLVALGFRRVTRTEEVTPKPAPDRAWLAVRLKRSNPHDSTPVRVMLSGDGEPYKLVGMIVGKTSPGGFLRWFLQDATRFPTIAGYSVPGDHEYAIRLERDGVGLSPDYSQTWGPFLVAKGAVIDVELTL